MATDRRRRSRSGRLADALIWGAALGAASGAVIGDAIDDIGAAAGAVAGAVLYAPAEAFSSLSRGVAEPQPLWHRILSSALLMAVFGWVLGLIYGPDEALITAVISGGLLGLLGLRPVKFAIGLLVGAAVGTLLETLDADIGAAPGGGPCGSRPPPPSSGRWSPRRSRSSTASPPRSPTATARWSGSWPKRFRPPSCAMSCRSRRDRVTSEPT